MIAFQLFSSRNTALETALSIIAKAGYKGVEAYGANTSMEVIDSFKQGLAKNQLQLVSMHIDIKRFRSEFQQCVDLAGELDCNHLVCPFLLPELRPANVSAWTALAQELEDITHKCARADLTFAWHNHDFEFDKLADDITPMQILLEHAPAMQWEIDLGWILRTGDKPLQWLAQYRSRISAIHIKDVAIPGSNTDEDGWADVGFGTQDWQALWPEISACSEPLLIAEHDNPNDLERFARQSINTINGWTV